MSYFSEKALEAFYNGDLDGTALGRKIRSQELEEELRTEYWLGEMS